MSFLGMFMSKKLLILFWTIFLLAAQSMAAVAGSAKVRYIEGDVQRIKYGNTEWKELRVGQKVELSDAVRTGIESMATLSLKDGSMVSVIENSVISFSDLIDEDGSFRTAIDVTTGRLIFSVQKQERNSQFKFKTGTMSAAIRGTEGCIDGGDYSLVGLKNGALQIELTSGENVLIQGGQVAFKKDSLVVLDLRSAGEAGFHKRLANMLMDSSITKDELINRIRQEDEAYQQAIKEAQKQVQCVFEGVPDTIRSREILVYGRCPVGSKVLFYGESVQLDQNGKFTQSIPSGTTAVGEKRFKLTCSAGQVQFDCAEVKTYYQPSEAFFQNSYKLASLVPATICEDGLAIEGTYQVKDSLAKLFLNVGNVYKSPNLIRIADGEIHPFAQNVMLSDRNGLWNANAVSLEFEAGGVKEIRKFPLKVDHSCRNVNQNSPTLQFIGYDSLACKASFAIGNNQDDVGIFRVDIDNMGGKSTIIEKDKTAMVSLKTGIHDYEFFAEDQAGNVATLSKTLGCYPNKFFGIRIDGGRGNEVVWGGFQSYPGGRKAPIQRTLRFSIDLPSEKEVYSVQVRHNGRIILRETSVQIASLDYEVPINLVLKKNKIEIMVKHKSGFVATATKIYEVK